MNKDLNSVEELMKILNDTNLTNISFEEEGFKVEIKRSNVVTAVEEVVAEEVAEVVAPAYKEVKSENVGKFYYVDKSGNPMVKVGDRVKKNQEIGYIATIGVKSSVKSTFDGVVKEILLDNGSIADFGKTLIKIEAE